jgi:ElaB/YqjD/DUF883 family membrane-anchored ribosome-binding protein
MSNLPGGGSPGGSAADRPGNGTIGAVAAPAGSRRWTRADDAGRSEFGAFLDELSELAHGSHVTSELRVELERRVAQARDRMHATLDQGRALTVRATERARDRMQHGVEVSRDAVAERPLSAVALAALGGLLVGLLISRRD